ncbi:NUDIX hydrolase domain-like protein [Thamnocephalis sphaerospora]|uniref:NUDIX hydrolase domain-like protein n=1 Tax=Thamnocephalis sphaerospora TaxID=78915 RepID=A0A4P9XWA1_9FUNG|nr:NUDIX hydrolase domain-like protein [Thamnocephalis sphaerospora]|eukprot:RKP10603.1 NUDIX hydrolase domain-like protein [Thamnocephalis sphaerospora]
MLPDALDAATLATFRTRLKHACPLRYRYKYSTSRPTRDAGVLVPFCMVDGRPSVLFTVRSARLNTHRGEVSFPGGKRDPDDVTLVATALRETHEEIGLALDQVDVLGTHHPLPDKTLTIRVHPVIGCLRTPFSAEAPVSGLQFARDEVADVFAVSLQQLADPRCWRLARFRAGAGPVVPVWRVEGLPGIPAGTPEIWGLTAFVLDGVLRTLFNVDRLEVADAWQRIGEAALRVT